MIGTPVTDCHSPDLTLLMRISEFAVRDVVLAAYAEALGEAYRYFSINNAICVASEAPCGGARPKPQRRARLRGDFRRDPSFPQRRPR